MSGNKEKETFSFTISTIFLLLMVLNFSCQCCEAAGVQLSQQRSGLAATTNGNLSFFAGGFNSLQIDAYNAQTNTWSTPYFESLSIVRGFLAATTVGNFSLFAGGQDSLYAQNFYDVVDIYDAKNPDTITSGSFLSYPRSQLAATSVGHLALFAGGCDSESVFSVVDIYNSSNGSWNTTNLSSPSYQLAATTVRSLAMFAGGCLDIHCQTLSQTVDIYNYSSSLWSTARLSESRFGLAATTLGSVALFAGGAASEDSFSSVVDIFNASTNTWSYGMLSQARGFLAATSVGSYAIFAGGVASLEPLATVDLYNTATNVWTSWTLAVPRSYLAATSVQGVAMFAGGESPGGPSAQVDIYNSSAALWNPDCPPGTCSCPGYDICQNCTAGYFSNTTNAWQCTPCPAGTAYGGYPPATNASFCQKCSPGTYAGQGAFECRNCMAGYYSSQAGAVSVSACQVCPPGTWSAPGAPFCQNCTAGMYSNATAANSSAVCQMCGPGTYSGSAGSASCTNCTAGTYSNFTGANDESYCQECAAGTFSSSSASACEQCGAGTYSPAGSPTCLQCPNGALSQPGASTCTPSGNDIASSTPFENMAFELGVGIGGGGCVLLTLGVVLLACFRRRRSAALRQSEDVALQNLGSAYSPVIHSESTAYADVPGPLLDDDTSGIGSAASASKEMRALGADHSVISFSELSIGRKLGSGASGVVYEGKWRGTLVAIKDIGSQVTDKERDQFFTELEIMRNLRAHQNVVQFFGYSTSAAHPLLVIMALCEEGSLYNLLRSAGVGRIKQADWTRIIRGMTAGILHLHHESIVHRDLAARNILLGKNYEAKVTDFGLSRTVDAGAGVTSSNTGPLKHLAPECMLRRMYSFKSDVWAYAVTLWEIFERQDPYPELTAVEAASRVVQTVNPLRLPVPKGMSKQLGVLFLSCLSTQPERRPSMSEISETLDSLEGRLFEVHQP